jgi:hypothetical protein
MVNACKISGAAIKMVRHSEGTLGVYGTYGATYFSRYF